MSLLTSYILLMILKYNLLAEITLKLGLKPIYCLCVFLFFYYYVRSVLFKIHAANIEASKFFVLLLSVTMENYS